jgi:hypothetical protein
MRPLARWSIVLALFSAIVVAAAQPAWLQATTRLAAADSVAGPDSPKPSGGLKSQPVPQSQSYIGPATTFVGTASVKALIASPTILNWFQTERFDRASPHAVPVPRASVHLRSIPLLI